jgi:hypothetical protein
MAEDNFGWWISRITLTGLVDMVRIDARGFETLKCLPAKPPLSKAMGSERMVS